MSSCKTDMNLQKILDNQQKILTESKKRVLAKIKTQKGRNRTSVLVPVLEIILSKRNDGYSFEWISLFLHTKGLVNKKLNKSTISRFTANYLKG